MKRKRERVRKYEGKEKEGKLKTFPPPSLSL
jgi:hypothetical protein